MSTISGGYHINFSTNEKNNIFPGFLMSYERFHHNEVDKHCPKSFYHAGDKIHVIDSSREKYSCLITINSTSPIEVVVYKIDQLLNGEDKNSGVMVFETEEYGKRGKEIGR